MYPSCFFPSATALFFAVVSTALILSPAPSAKASSYVFATFKGDRDAGEKLSIYTSTDAFNFQLLSDTGFEGSSKTLRDPSIMRYTDGKYYVAYTNPPGDSCCGKEDHFSIASSTDLIHWTDVTTVKAGVTGVAHTWAPEWFIDGTTINIIANIDTLNNDTDFKPYVFTAQNSGLTSWSGPVPLGVGPNYIDAAVVKSGATYHAFVKNETTRFLEHAVASKLTGPWSFVGTGNWAGWGSGKEGPCLVKLDDGTWRLYVDGQGSTGFLYANSSDLMRWSAMSPLPAVSDIVRHGTIIINNLAQAKLATADSAQSTHQPAAANDGVTSTRWSSSNGGLNHWWQVDLGGTHFLVGSEVAWEWSGRNYRYKVEGSVDGAAWLTLADKTGSTSTSQIQSDNYSANARYVRITVTGLPTTPTTWASFSEFRVFGR